MPQTQTDPNKIDWGKLPDIDFDNLPDKTQPEEKSFIGKAWDWLSTPLTTAPSDAARNVGTSMTEHSLDENPLWAETKGFGAGALQGIGDMVSGLTSPIGLATSAMGGGEYAAAKAGLPEIASALRLGTRAASVPFVIHGTREALSPDKSFSDRALGLAEAAGGLVGTVHGPEVNSNASKLGTIAESVKKPEIIPNLEEAFNEMRGTPKEAPDMTIGRTVDRTKLINKTNESDDIDKLMEGLPDQHLDIVNPDEGIQVNGSGESSASMEAINRQSAMKANGEQFVVYDKQGNKRPLIGPDAVDYTPAKGESKGVEGPNGFQLLDDNGGLHPAKLQAKIIAIQRNVDKKGNVSPETTQLLNDLKAKQPQTTVTTNSSEPAAIYIKKPNPDVIKQVMQHGYSFDSIRDDGAFKMVKSSKPMNLPVLESETGRTNARPTPANAARMGMGQQPPIPPNDNRIINSGSPNPNTPKRNYVTEAINFPRTIMASMDFSAPLRQGMTLIHKKAFWTSLDDMFKAWGSNKAYNAIQEDIQNKPLFKPRMAPGGQPIRSFAEEAGLKLTDLKSLSNREEAIMSSWADKVPGVARSNRAYTAFLNKLRADTFEDLIKQGKVFGANGETNLPLAREIANFVNAASGRGSLGPLEKSATTLNNLLFSPRLIASRLTLLNPKYYITANPFVRKEALKSLFAVAAAGNTITQLGKMAGGTVESDPTSSDFGKLKIGNVRLDPYAGFQQYIVAASRLLSQREMSSISGKVSDLSNPKGPYDPTNMDLVTRFARGKVNPLLGFAWSLLAGQKEMSGQKMNLTTMNPMDNAVAQRFIPILMQDLYSIAQEDPSLLPILGPAATFGMGTQVYGGGQ